MSTLRRSALALLSVLAVAACTSGASSTPSAAGASTPASVAASASPSAAAGGANAVDIKGFAFNPATLTVTAGTKVTWTNSDGTAHTVTLDDNSVDSGNINGSATFDHTFATAGTFPYRCKIHSNMKGTVTVSG